MFKLFLIVNFHVVLQLAPEIPLLTAECSDFDLVTKLKVLILAFLYL